MAKNRVQVQGVSAPTLNNSIGGLGQTFVSPEANPRGAQIAKALQGVAPVIQQKVNEYQEDVRFVDGLKAKNAFGVLAPSINEHMANADYSIREQADGTIRRMTADEHFASWEQAGQYEEMRQGLGSLTAMQALESSIGQAVADGYGAGTVAYDQTELRETLSQSLQMELDNGTPNAVANFDAMLVANNLASRKESMEIMREEAAHRMRTTGDESIFDYITETGMGNGKWKDATDKIREGIANKRAVDNDNDRKRMLNARTDTKADLMVQAATRLNEDPHANLDDLNNKALEAGISDFKGSSNTLRKTYNPASTGEYKMDLNDRVELYKALSALPTKEKQLAFLQENSTTIDRATQGTWLGYVNSGSLPTFRDDENYKAVVKGLDQKLETTGAEDSLFLVQQHLDDLFFQVVQEERWVNAGVLERMSMAQDIVVIAKERAGVGIEGSENQPLTFAKQQQEIKAKEDEAAQVALEAKAIADQKRVDEIEARLNKLDKLNKLNKLDKLNQ